MRCVVSCGSTSFPWLVLFFAALLWGSMIHKHTTKGNTANKGHNDRASNRLGQPLPGLQVNSRQVTPARSHLPITRGKGIIKYDSLINKTIRHKINTPNALNVFGGRKSMNFLSATAQPTDFVHCPRLIGSTVNEEERCSVRKTLGETEYKMHSSVAFSVKTSFLSEHEQQSSEKKKNRILIINFSCLILQSPWCHYIREKILMELACKCPTQIHRTKQLFST